MKLNFNFLCKNPDGSISIGERGKNINIGEILSTYLLHGNFKEGDALSKFALAGKVKSEFDANDAEYDLIKKMLDSKLLPPIFEANIRIYLNSLKD